MQQKHEEEKYQFVRSLINFEDGQEKYIFPNQDIKNVYEAHIAANKKDNFGPTILHSELPKTSKAFRKDSTSNEMAIARGR